ncbi:MAG: GIY-YIG nuclease family protein [Candidatus Thermoplasmatota archaeon]|jgi:Uri superfamily endonuclease|nr:GIY-YIG nuclease family protein [Candidatus Thermoplasmatota archaeon]
MKGSYILIIKLEEDKKIQIGKLGEIFFKNGFYVYVGSALNGIEQRINRHLRKNKKKHWHIDYLLDYAKVIEILYKESRTRLECNIAEIFDKQLFSISGFGCSDCKCKSHLFFNSYEKIKNVIKNLKMVHYALKKKGEN